MNIDIIGCYNNGLKHQLYPIEHPVIVSYPRQSKQNQYDSLRKFLKHYCKKLVYDLHMFQLIKTLKYHKIFSYFVCLDIIQKNFLKLRYI